MRILGFNKPIFSPDKPKETEEAGFCLTKMTALKLAHEALHHGEALALPAQVQKSSLKGRAQLVCDSIQNDEVLQVLIAQSIIDLKADDKHVPSASEVKAIERYRDFMRETYPPTDQKLESGKFLMALSEVVEMAREAYKNSTPMPYINQRLGTPIANFLDKELPGFREISGGIVRNAIALDEAEKRKIDIWDNTKLDTSNLRADLAAAYERAVDEAVQAFREGMESTLSNMVHY